MEAKAPCRSCSELLKFLVFKTRYIHGREVSASLGPELKPHLDLVELIQSSNSCDLCERLLTSIREGEVGCSDSTYDSSDLLLREQHSGGAAPSLCYKVHTSHDGILVLVFLKKHDTGSGQPVGILYVQHGLSKYSYALVHVTDGVIRYRTEPDSKAYATPAAA